MLQLLLTGDQVVSYWPQSVENRAALRTAFAVLFAILTSFAFHLQTPYWSGMSVLVIANLYTGSIIDKAMMRVIGTIAGAFLGLTMALFVANSLLLYLLSCFLVIAVAVYYYNFSNYAYGYLLGALCTFIVISQIAFEPQNVFFVAIWRPVEIAIGVLVSAVCAYAIFPNHLKDNVLIQVHDIFDDFSLEFKQLLQSLNQGSVDFALVSQSNLKIKKKLRKATELIGAMNRELGVSKERTDELRALLDSFYDLARQLQYLLITSPQPNDVKALKLLPIEAVFTAIQHDLDSLKVAFSQNPPQSFALETQETIADLEKQFNLKSKKASVKSDFVYSFIHFLYQVDQVFLLMHSLLTGAPVKNQTQILLISKKQRLQADKDVVKHSIKAGFSVILALGFWFVSNWPGGLNGIISSLIISIRKNLFEMKNISIHRLLGCFCGGGLALLSLIILEMNLFDFAIVLFFGIWGFSYFMFKSPKYSYIGLQANIALIISLAQEGGPPVLLDPPLQRLAGIVIGIVSSFLVANIFWRSDIWTILQRYLTKLYRLMIINLKQVLFVTGEQLHLHDLANIFWVSRGLLESLAELPNLSVKKQNKLTQFQQKFESLVIIQATISHILVTIDRDKAAKTAELLDWDLALYERQLVALFEKNDQAAKEALSQKLQNFLLEMDKKAAYKKLKDQDVRNLVAYVNALNHLARRVE